MISFPDSRAGNTAVEVDRRTVDGEVVVMEAGGGTCVLGQRRERNSQTSDEGHDQSTGKGMKHHSRIQGVPP